MIAPTPAAMPTRLIPHQGLRFTADVCGPESGQTVLLLHGFPQSRHAWRRQLPVLAQAGFRCVAPDQRGYSPEARPSGTEAYRAEHLVADALGIMAALGARHFHLVGIDWGGQVAWNLAAHAPDRVSTLTVLSRPHPVAFAQSLRADAQQAGRSIHHRTLLEPDAPRRWREDDMAALRERLRQHGVPDDTAAGYVGTLRPPGALEAAIEWYRAAAGGLGMSHLAPIRMPTMYLWGSDDHTVGRHAAEATAQHAGDDYRFVEIPGAGHFLSDQVPDRVNALLLEHLGRAAGHPRP